MNRLIVSAGCIAAILLSTSLGLAQGRGNGGPKVKPTTGAGAKAAGAGKTSGPRGTGQGAAKTHGAAGKSNAGAHAAKTPKVTGPKSKTTTATTTATDAATAKTNKKGLTGTTAAGETVQQKLQRNTNLADKLETRLAGKLPAGMDLMDAADGFSNLGKFVSAVNAAHNHDLDFVKLKTAIVKDGASLGQAMKEQRTSLDTKAEARRAQSEADSLIKSTETVAPSTTKARPPSSKGAR